MTEWPEWMKLPPEMWNELEVLNFVKKHRNESVLPTVYPLTLDEFIEWLEKMAPESDTLRGMKWWQNKYYQEMQRETR